MKRAFFVALGVPRGAQPEAIKTAYRRIVTRYRRELELEEADWEEEPTQPPAQGFGVMRSYHERRHSALFEEPAAEPLIPPQSRASEVDRFYDGFVPEALTPPRARQKGKDLFVELRFTEDEASRGGLFAVHIPVVRHCPRCNDREEHDRITCHHCHGSGQVLEDRMVEVTAPPGLEHGHTTRVAMEDVGLDDTDLIIRVLIPPR
jgi:hypothetical protein